MVINHKKLPPDIAPTAIYQHYNISVYKFQPLELPDLRFGMVVVEADC